MASQSVDMIFEAKDAACFKVVGGRREFFARGALKVLRHGIEGHGVIFVMVQNFQYPLRGDIPVLKAAPRTYVFTFPGQLFYGIVIPESVPQEQVVAFESILGSEADLHSTEEEDEEVSYPPVVQASSPPTTSAMVVASSSAPSVPSADTAVAISKVETGIEICSRMAAQGLITGAAIVGSGMKKGGKFVISKVKPAETPMKVSESTKSAIRSAKMASVTAISVSSALVTGVVAMSSNLASALAKSFADTEYGKKLASANTPAANAAKSAAVTTISAVENVLLAAFEASNIILKDLGEATTEIVDHKYGKEAGETSKEVFSLTTDLVEVTRNVNRLGITSIATATAVAATKTTLSDGSAPNTAKSLAAAGSF